MKAPLKNFFRLFGYIPMILLGCSTLLAGAQALEQLHDEQLDAAYEDLLQVLLESPCNEDAIQGLDQIGRIWSQIEDKQDSVLIIYETLHRCRPNDPDILYFLGVHLGRAGRWKEAKNVLEECLALAPQYRDADIQIGYLHLWQNQLDDAESIFVKYPDHPDAQLGLASVLQKKGKSQHAQELHRKIIAQYPDYRESRQALARSLASDLNFSEAASQYQWLVDDEPNTQAHWTEWFDVKSHTNCALFLESNYTDAKENDPTIRAPVVKDYYFLSAIHCLVPLFDRWRLDVKQFYYHQRENDIYPPVGVNYSAYLAGAQLTSSWFFAKYWKWDVFARAFEGWGWRHVNYPFHRTTRFEPGTSFLYNEDPHLFALDAHRESFIIKNFALERSELLRTDFLTTIYRYRIPADLKPELEAQLSHVWIQGNNWKNTETGIVRCKIPWLNYFTITYQFDHGHFNKLNQNYYSFKQQLMDTLGICFHCDIHSRAYLETTYEHRWKTTYRLYQPIGNFIFVANKQYLVANKVTSKFSFRYNSLLRLELEGHYFYETLPYRDWNINGSLLWQF